MNAFKLARIRDVHPKKVVRAASHQITFADLWVLSDGSFEAIQIVFGLLF